MGTSSKVIIQADPCPFCGAESPMQTHVDDVRRNTGGELWKCVRTFYVRCFKCDGHGPRALTQAESIEKWNERIVSLKICAEDARKVNAINTLI